MTSITILSVGGSIVAPDDVDIPFVMEFKNMLISYLEEDQERRVVLIIGGGGPARKYQEAYRKLNDSPDPRQQDWIGIMATRLNAELIRGVFGSYCRQPVITDPTAVRSFEGRVLVAAGWKPGFSTDNDAVVLAENLGADTLINLSNIPKIYSDDPKTNPDAKALDSISWPDFLTMVGDEWTPGKNCPFDPVASKRAAGLGLRVITAAGKDIGNTRDILAGRSFQGTIID